MKTLVEQIEDARNWARRYETIMTDLTNLSPDELLKYPRGIDQNGSAYVIPSYTPQTIAEIRRRLARLEECEGALARFQSGKPELGDLSLREGIRSELITQGLKDAEKLEQCKAALRMFFENDTCFCSANECRHTAARAALERND